MKNKTEARNSAFEKYEQADYKTEVNLLVTMTRSCFDYAAFAGRTRADFLNLLYTIVKSIETTCPQYFVNVNPNPPLETKEN